MLQAVKFIGLGPFVRTPKEIAYYMNLNNPRVVRELRYRFKEKTIIYGIRCQVDNLIYIGSSFAPSLRFHQHFVTGYHSNTRLQEAIALHGLSKFTVHVFEIIEFPSTAKYADRKATLLQVEQRYLDHFPMVQKYNSINASNK